MIRNQLLYPAELRGRGGFPRFFAPCPQALAEQNGASGHTAARSRHNSGHNGGTTNASRAGAYRRWTPEETARLAEVRAGLITRRQLAEQIGRSFKAVKRKLCP